MRLDRLAQSLLLILLFTVPALFAARVAAVGDPDIWWHLRTGEWIVQHRAIPHTDPFSAYGAGRPWAPYSWLFEVLVFCLFRQLGLVGIVTYTCALVMAITVAVYQMVHNRLQRTSRSVLLTFAICLSLGHLYTPRPWLFTILFFTVELAIIMHARDTGRTRHLGWLPLLFLLWANIHIQFVDGLFVLALTSAEALYGSLYPSSKVSLKPTPTLLVMLLSVAGTLCNPFGWHIYQVARDLASQPGVLNKLQELQAMPFRDLADWGVLTLGAAALMALARMQRFPFLETFLLAIAGILAFRSQRDVWILVISAGAILARRTAWKRHRVSSSPLWSLPAMAGVAAISVLLCLPRLSINEQILNQRLAAEMPIEATKFVRAHTYHGQIYNDYGWGGFLIWELRQPVSIDGRAALHGDRRIFQSNDTWGGHPAWQNDPELSSAGLVIGPRNAPLSQLLRLDRRFQLVYEDGLAVVFFQNDSK